MQAITVINNFPETKEQIKHFAQLVKDSVNDGNTNALDLMIKFKAIDSTIEEIKKEILQEAIKQAELNGKSYEYSNCKVEIAQAGVKYDYTQCGDTEWTEIVKEIENLTERKKVRETFLKSIQSKTGIVDHNGEVIEVLPPTKQSTETIKITLK